MHGSTRSFAIGISISLVLNVAQCGNTARRLSAPFAWKRPEWPGPLSRATQPVHHPSATHRAHELPPSSRRSSFCLSHRSERLLCGNLAAFSPHRLVANLVPSTAKGRNEEDIFSRTPFHSLCQHSTRTHPLTLYLGPPMKRPSISVPLQSKA